VDFLSVGLVLVFAFLAGSFVARNSDVWLHLATGRLLARGDYHFGTDPFAYTTAGVYWANHAWLFDLGLYLAFGPLGGAGLVVLKALAVAATAAVMLFAARGRGPRWVATGCVSLAVLAMSPRLLLQPSVASLLLLAGCLACLRAGGKALRAVPALIAVWVNVDSWFVLGPLAVGLWWVGRRIDPDRDSLPAWPAWFVPACLAATLLSPHHVFALRLPMEVSPAVWASGFPTDPRFERVFDSPWHAEPLGAAGGYNLAAWAFFALLGLGLASFALNRRAVRSWRGAVWLPLALLAAWQGRLVPFFGVAAGVVTALNLREVLPPAAFARPGRGFVLAGVVVLAALAWFGLTNGFYNPDRGAGWGVYADPTQAKAAGDLAAWRRESGVPDSAHVFPTFADTGHYLAWFAPGERAFLDSRLQLFTGVADDFAALSRAVGVLPSAGDPPPADALRSHDIVAVLLSDPDPFRTARPLSRAARGEFAIVKVSGGAVLLVPPGGPGSATRFDPEKAAFGGAADLPVAGPGPASLAEPRPWWVPTRGHGRKGSWEADAATVYLRLQEVAAPKSPALPLLSVRAARAGAEVDPADPVAWGTLGRAYATLASQSWEHEAGAGLVALDRVRFVQTVTALVQASLRNPRSVSAHELLARVLAHRNILDVARRHAAEGLRLVREAGPASGESAEAFEERVGRTAAFVDPLEQAVQDSENRFLIRTAGMSGDPLARARTAVELGLSQKAIDVLLQSHPDLYGMTGLALLADLLLQTGQAAECRVLLDREELRRNPDGLGFYSLPRGQGQGGSDPLPAYDWLDLCQSAAAGRYEAAAAALDRLCGRLDEVERLELPPVRRTTSLLLASEAGLWVPTNPLLGRLPMARERAGWAGRFVDVRARSITRADLLTLAGVLELERGAVPGAETRFAAALELYEKSKDLGHPLPGRPLAARYHEAIRGTR
jgi:hypothetical protein